MKKIVTLDKKSILFRRSLINNIEYQPRDEPNLTFSSPNRVRLGMVPTCLPKARDGHHKSALALNLLGLGPLGPNPTGSDLATRLG